MGLSPFIKISPEKRRDSGEPAYSCCPVNDLESSILSFDFSSSASNDSLVVSNLGFSSLGSSWLRVFGGGSKDILFSFYKSRSASSRFNFCFKY